VIDFIIDVCGKCGCGYTENTCDSVGSIEIYREVVSEYKSNANKRNLEFSLTHEQCKGLLFANCFYCGAKPSRQKNGRSTRFKGQYIYVNGIDRLNSNYGYNVNNTVSCCFRCNFMKREYSLDSFFEHIKLISERHGLCVSE